MKTLSIIFASWALTLSSAHGADVSNAGLNHDVPVSTYEVTVTNITRGQYFTPIIVASHARKAYFYKLGAAPSQDLADIAEGGDTSGLQASLEAMPDLVLDIQNTGDGLIGPGESRTVTLTTDAYFNRLSLAGMLLPTNDTFVGINGLKLPNRSATVLAIAYDAGSEENDELCANIPGPQCGGQPFSEGLAEGYVHVSGGTHGEGDLSRSDYDWRNPVAQVSIKRISHED